MRCCVGPAIAARVCPVSYLALILIFLPSGYFTDYRIFLFSSRGRHTRSLCDWSSDMCSSDLALRAAVRRAELEVEHAAHRGAERADVGVLDVATILAQMHGDAVGAAPLGRRRGAHGVGRSEERRVGKGRRPRCAGATHSEKRT